MARKKLISVIIGAGVFYLLLLINPNVLFAEHRKYRGFDIYSDKPIPTEIESVIDDVIVRISRSELYDASNHFDLYLCNSSWRFKLLTRNGQAGGLVNFLVSANIFIRENDIQSNKIVPPVSWKNSLEDRPLSYFIAHESVHCLQREYDRFLVLNTPVEIIEGYAEYTAKSTSNELNKLIGDWEKQKPTMNPKNGLYDKYNLYVGYLIEQENYDFEKLVAEKPSMDEVLQEILNDAVR